MKDARKLEEREKFIEEITHQIKFLTAYTSVGPLPIRETKTLYNKEK